jgi:NADH dehydrogenase
MPATIGWRDAVVNLRYLHLTGFPGWLFWGMAHIYFLIGLRSRFVVAFTWAWQYLTFQRGARLITGMSWHDEAPNSAREDAPSTAIEFVRLLPALRG